MDLSVRSAPVPQVDEHPQAVDRQSEQGEDDDHLEIQAVEEGLYLGDREKQCVLVDILPGNEVHHADGLARQLQLHRAHHIALLAKQKGIGLVVAGHWGTENAIADVLAQTLREHFPALDIAHAESDTDPYQYLV